MSLFKERRGFSGVTSHAGEELAKAVGMDKATPGSSERSGPAKPAVDFYRQRIHGRKPDYKTQFPRPEESSSKTRELHLAKMDVNRLRESRNAAEKEKARAESELYRVRNVVKELAQQIDESNARVKARRTELQSVRKSNTIKDERSPLDGDGDGHQYMELMREMDQVKQELSRLKLDVASALEAKAKAEKEIEASSSKARLYEGSMEEIRRQIDEANEEQVLVELARMEAQREHTEIEAEREAEATRFSKTIEAARTRITELRREIGRAKELEAKLAITTSDVNVLQNEMELVRTMERNLQSNRKDFNERRKEEGESSSLLQSAEAELKAAKKELASIKDEGFKFMTSMDLVREEMAQIVKETERLKKMEKKADATVQHLNSKLLKAKSRLESATVGDEKAKAVVSNLSEALRQLQTEIEAAKREKKLISEETRAIKAEIEKTDSSIESAEERLQAAMQELEAVKASEAMALKKLETVTERTVRTRTSSSLNGAAITISKFEYDYLSRRATAAQEVADKKVAASQAWIDALKASEKEIAMRTEQAKKEIKESKFVEEQEAYKTEKTLITQEVMEEELPNWRQDEQEAVREDLQLTVARGRKSSNRESGIPVGQRRAKIRRISASSGIRYNARSPSFTIKRRRKVMPYLAKLLQGERNGKRK